MNRNPDEPDPLRIDDYCHLDSCSTSWKSPPDIQANEDYYINKSENKTEMMKISCNGPFWLGFWEKFPDWTPSFAYLFSTTVGAISNPIQKCAGGNPVSAFNSIFPFDHRMFPFTEHRMFSLVHVILSPFLSKFLLLFYFSRIYIKTNRMYPYKSA